MVPDMNDEQLLRYSRQIMLPEVDIEGQQRLADARVLIVGIGGLGSPVALYLAAAGVGHLTLCDHDAVDLSNLQRQIAHDTSRIGCNKAESAAQHIAQLNPHVDTLVIDRQIDHKFWQQPDAYDLVIDATDNFDTRLMINEQCWPANIPVVSGAAIRWEGQVALFDPNVPDAPCYRCLYTEADEVALNCAENGVIAPLVGIIGACQAMEAIKYLCKIGESLAGYVLYLDAKYMEWRKLKLNRRSNCPVCSS